MRRGSSVQYFALIFLLLLEFFIVACQQSTLKMFSNPLDATSLPFQRMVVERQFTGKVFLAGVNRVYQLNADLQLMSTYESGPLLDSPDCSVTTQCDDASKGHLTNNYNKALALYMAHNKLVVCGSMRQGLCRLHNIYNVSSVDPPVLEALVANDKDSSSFVFVAPGVPDPPRTNTLYVASTYTNTGPYRDDIPAVATLSLQADNMFKPAHRSIESESRILIERSRRKSYRIEYVFGFASGNYSYFVSRQPVSGQSTYESKLIRLCQADKDYYSYTEVPLECKSQDGTNFNLIQAAYVGKAGFDLARNMSISTEDDLLFGVFAKSDETVSQDPSKRNIPARMSALCIYSLKSVEQVFAENIRKCADGGISRGLDFIRKDAMCYKTTLDSLCGSEVNNPVGGSIPVSRRPIFVDKSRIFTSVFSATVHMYTAVFIGTDDGVVKKLVIDGNTSSNQYDQIELENGPVNILDLQTDISGEFIYVLAANSLLKVKLINCDRLEKCSACLVARDPYCGWCTSGSRCSSKGFCSNSHDIWLTYKEDQCTEITKVTPDKIPISQAQYLNLDIQNLPNFSGQLSCVFAINDHNKITTGATRINSNAVSCNTPQPSSLPRIPFGTDSLTASLSVQIDSGSDFAATNFTFFDCASFKSCSVCTTSRFPCDWCVESGQCSHNSSKCQAVIAGTAATNRKARKSGAEFCPKILPLRQNESEIFVSAGSDREISVRAYNLMEFHKQFACRFELGIRVYEVSATLNKAEQTISCARVNLSYVDNLPDFTAHLNVVWIDENHLVKPLDNAENVRAVIYKCEESASNCGLCLNLNPNLQCGWCSSIKQCSTSRKCNSQTNDWLEKSVLCPWPEITKFHPRTGPVEGGTELIVEGVNLGRSFADIQNNLRVAHVTCSPIRHAYRTSSRLVCVTGPSHMRKVTNGSVVLQLRDDRQFLAISNDYFRYVDPVITGFSPLSGPQSGGTTVTIFGDNIDAGSNVTASIGGVPCQMIETTKTRSQCRTGFSTVAVKQGGILMSFDGASRKFVEYQFTYDLDPTVLSISRAKSIVSGGLTIDVVGLRFNLTQHVSLSFIYASNRTFEAPCFVENNEHMKCLTPNISPLLNDPRFPRDDSKYPLLIAYEFRLDALTINRNVTVQATRRPVDFFEVFPDPQLFDFANAASSANPADDSDHYRLRVQHYSDYLVVQGKNLNRVVTESDVKVLVGGRLRCNISTWHDQALACKMPSKQKIVQSAQQSPAADNDRRSDFSSKVSLVEVVVVVGENNFNYSLGYVDYEDPVQAKLFSTETIVAASSALACVLIGVFCLVFWYNRKSNRQRNHVKHLKDQIDSIELKVASECKEAFAELQTDMTELTADMGCSSAAGIPFLSYRDFALQLIFPGQTNNPAFRDLNIDPQLRASVEKGLHLFNQLLMNKQFLILMIRTMESNRLFVSQSKVAVGSLMMIILQEKMEYCTDILKTLLADLIGKTIEKRCQPKILFRRSESVAERMLGIWYSLLLYRYIIDCAGHPFFMLYLAIKQQVEKGPQDAVVYESRYSLSEEKLIRQTVDFHALTIYVSSIEHGSMEVPVRVFDCDTITQVKEKCLDAIYKTTPYSRRPAPSDVDLEWRTGVSGRLVLQDLNSSTKVEPGGWRKLNTLGYFKVPNNASLALVPRQISVYNLSLMSERSDKSSTFSLKNLTNVGSGSPVLGASRNQSAAVAPHHGASSQYGTKDSQDMSSTNGRVYHLIKPLAAESSADEKPGGKMMSEIYLTRLLTTKGTLQKFVEDFFEAIFSTAYRGWVLPVSVKYMFDFMDDQALLHGITDPEVVHTWKSNSLPLRFWVNLIKNPNFVFDIARPVKIEGCLSVVAQTLMDSCSTQDPQLTKDSPSSKLLFARDIHQYRSWVEKYFNDVRQMPIISDQDMSAYLNDESRQHQGELGAAVSAWALYELYETHVKPLGLDQLGAALQQDEAARRCRLPTKFAQLRRLMDGDDVLPPSNRSSHTTAPPPPPPLSNPPGCYTYGDVSLPR